MCDICFILIMRNYQPWPFLSPIETLYFYNTD